MRGKARCEAESLAQVGDAPGEGSSGSPRGPFPAIQPEIPIRSAGVPLVPSPGLSAAFGWRIFVSLSGPKSRFGQSRGRE